MSRRHLVIGVGNRDRGDDAVGPVICDRVADLGLAGVETVVLEAGGVDLAAYWSPDDRVTIVDAAQPAGQPGRMTAVDALTTDLPHAGAVSTHVVDVAASIELARVLDVLPSELTVVGIEGERFDFGDGLSPAVLAQVDDVVQHLSTRTE